MTHLARSLCLLALGLECVASLAREFEGARQNSVLLNNQWEFARGAGGEGVETAAGQRNVLWQPVTLPGPFTKWNQKTANQTKCVWARRSFQNDDVHPCGNVTETDEGHLQPAIRSWFEAAGNRTTTNTEYMNTFGRPPTQWVGREDPAADQLAVAQIGAEHTEAMRRARLDGIWPYMYAGWTRTRLAARVTETGKGSAVWKAENTTIAAELPASTGDGRGLFVQLDLQRRVDRSGLTYDPVAERVLLNLLGHGLTKG